MTDLPPAAAPPRRSRLGAVLWAVAFLVGGLLLATFLGALIFVGFHAIGVWPLGPVEQSLIVSGVSIISFGALTLLIGGRVLRFSAAELRWAVPHPARAILAGIAIGSAPALAALLLAVLVGGAAWVSDPILAGGPAIWLGAVVRTLGVLLVAALWEELAFRGVGLVALDRAFSRPVALGVLAIAFGLVHSNNPNVTALGVVNIAVAGVFLGVVFFTPGGIWASLGAHLGWNLSLAALDAAVSGMPFQIPTIDFHPGGPAWLTGGSFGPEGGLLATMTMSLATLAVVRWSRRAEGA